MKFQSLIISLLILLIISCSDENDFPDEPVINSVRFDEETRKMIIEFTDGDGNFGINGEDPDFPPFLDPDSTEPNPFYYNLWIDYFELRDGEWEFIQPENSFNFRIPVLTPSGQNKQLEVIITNDMSTEIPYLFAESDTIKFEIRLVDRAKNISLPAETGELIVPH